MNSRTVTTTMTELQAVAMIDAKQLYRKRKRYNSSSSNDGWRLFSGTIMPSQSAPYQADNTMLQVRIASPTVGFDLMRKDDLAPRINVTFSCPACKNTQHTLPCRSKLRRMEMMHRIPHPSPSNRMPWYQQPNRAYESAVGWAVWVRHADCL